METIWYNLIQIDTTTAMGRLIMLLPKNAHIEPFLDRGDCVSLTFLDQKSHLIHQFPKLSLRHLGSCRTGGIFFGHSSFQVCHTGALEGKFSSVNKDKSKRSWKLTQERNLSTGISRPLWNVHQQQPRLLHASRMNNVQGSVNEDGDLPSDAQTKWTKLQNVDQKSLKKSQFHGTFGGPWSIAPWKFDQGVEKGLAQPSKSRTDGKTDDENKTTRPCYTSCCLSSKKTQKLGFNGLNQNARFFVMSWHTNPEHCTRICLFSSIPWWSLVSTIRTHRQLAQKKSGAWKEPIRLGIQAYQKPTLEKNKAVWTTLAKKNDWKLMVYWNKIYSTFKPFDPRAILALEERKFVRLVKIFLEKKQTSMQCRFV